MLEIEVTCVLPSAFRCCVDDRQEPVEWKIQKIDRIKESVERQIKFLCDNWNQQTNGKATIRSHLCVSNATVTKLQEHRVKEPTVPQLVGHEAVRRSMCFVVWVTYPDDVYTQFADTRPYTRQDYMWIPTTEKKELADLESKEPRAAANHELKHWVKNRLEGIGVNNVPSPDGDNKDKYWEELNKALTPGNVRKLSQSIRERIDARVKETEAARAAPKK